MRNIKAKQILLIASLKGGVGKSTISSSLAYWLAQVKGHKTGLWDLDITSPSVTKVLGCQGEKITVGAELINPYEYSENLLVMSNDFFLPDTDQPIVWNGTKKSIAIRQFFKSVEFGKLDYLVLDTPPTTSDELLTILELIPKRKMNIIFVTQPSEVSENSVIKMIRMLTDRGYPIKGILSNMGDAICPSCDHNFGLFNEGMGVEEIANKYDIPYLGSVPINDGMIPETNLLDGDKFLTMAEKIMATAPVKHEERFTKRSLAAKAKLSVKTLSKIKKELNA